MAKRLVDDEQILEIIRKHQGENLTVRKLMNLLGYYSTSTVQGKLESLEKNGLIKRKVIRKSIIEVVCDKKELPKQPRKIKPSNDSIIRDQ